MEVKTDNEFLNEIRGLIYSRVDKFKSHQGNDLSWRIDEQDLIQECILGVYEAKKHFEEGKGVKLTTYLTTCIDNRIKDYYRRNARSYSISQKTNAALIKISNLQEEGLSNSEIAEKLNLSEHKVCFLNSLRCYEISLDKEVINDSKAGCLTYGDIIFKSKDTDKEFAEQIVYEVLEKIKKSREINSIDFEIFCKAYGLYCHEMKSVKELAIDYQMSESTVRRHLHVAEQIIFPLVKEKYTEFYA